MADKKNQVARCALSNPLSVILDKDPRDFRRSDLLRVIREKNIERITFHYTALDGKLKELTLPASDAGQIESLLAEGERVDGSSLFKGMVDTGLSDLYVVPVYHSAFFNPFDGRSLDFVCRYLTGEGDPAPYALDNILAKAAGLFRSRTGLDIHAMGELEFFLMSEGGRNAYSAAKQRGYHGSGPFVKSGPFLKEALRHMAMITGAVKYGHSEVGFIESVRSDIEEIRGKRAEQLEIEFQPRPVEDMGDALVLGRWLIRNLAYQNGLVATFTPKIEEGVAGSGLHFHMELMRSGRNVMIGPDGKLSAEARRLIGGLCHYADSLTAFGNTVSSAYLRLVPNQEAPTRICWSDLNRSAMIRVPLGWSKVRNLASRVNPVAETTTGAQGGRQTVELRSPDGSALIHLVLAGIVMAADWSLRKDRSRIQDGDPLELAERLYVVGNIFKDPDLLAKLPPLPTSCVASSRLLLRKRDLYERDGVFPPSVVDYAARMLAEEDDEFINEHLAGLSSNERLHETLRIMHKDLHRH
ncbi:MAG: glutamine synthetase [Candidatus Aminicenantes bacterium]|nr:glutamine synthetase [Candidatus Aminicenantes bacterium]